AVARGCGRRFVARIRNAIGLAAYPPEGLWGERSRASMSPADLSTLMGSERPCSSHPGPATALRWSGAQPSETVGLRPRSAGREDTAAAAPLVNRGDTKIPRPEKAGIRLTR